MARGRTPAIKDTYSTHDVAKICSVTPTTVIRWIEDGLIPAFKTVGGHRRVRRDDLERVCQQRGIPFNTPAGSSVGRVLVVDDEPVVLELVRDVVKDLNRDFEVEVARDAFDAGRLVALFRPQLIFLDLMMPGVDGFEVCNRLKKDPATRNTEVIAITGYYTESNMERILSAGAVACLKKPLDVDEVRARVAEAFDLPEAAAAACAAKTSPPSVLVITQSPDFRSRVRDELAAANPPVEVRTAQTGADALLVADSAQIALGVANGLLTLRTRALAEYQAMLLDQTSVLLDSLDDAGRVVTWNRASEQLLGVPAHRALGRCFGLDVARCEDPGRWEELWSELRAHGAFTAEVSLLAEEDGRAVPVPLHLEGRVLRDGGRLRGAVLVGLDLRARRALETQVLQSQKLAAVGLLAAGIAHEINNPLSGVVGYAKLLLGRGDLDPLVRERVEKIAASGERCRKIVEGVLLFARRQGGGVRKTVALHTLLDRVISLGEYQWRMHNVQVVRDPSDEVEVEADPERIEQVLLNLLSNAVDAMPHGGTIRVGLVRERGWARVEVQDQGEGIAPDVQSRIFDPFFSTKDLGKGTGLGLAISYGIVEDHGGTITVASAPGEGATFTVRLPQAAPVGPSTLESEPPAP